jgi:hypothetical protein
VTDDEMIAIEDDASSGPDLPAAQAAEAFEGDSKATGGDRHVLLEDLSVYETQADLVVRAKDQATDAKAQAEGALTKLITAATTSHIGSIAEIAKAIRAAERQIQDLVDNPGGLTELKALDKEAQAAFYAAAEKGDARVALAAWRAAIKETKEKASEIRDLNRARNGQIKNLLSAVKTLY